MNIYLPFFKADDFIKNKEYVNVSSYNQGDSFPKLGRIDHPGGAHFRLKLRFRLDNSEGYPNLFQTAEFNTGLRIEFKDSTATLIIADSSLKDGYRVIYISDQISVGQWYLLEIEALNHEYVRAFLDGQQVADVSSRGFSMQLSEFLLGVGFDRSRPFLGEIRDVSVVKGNLSRVTRAAVRYVPRSLHALLSLVATAGLALSLLLCALLKIGFFNGIRRAVTRIFKSAVGAPLRVIVFQGILLALLPAYKDVILIYLFLYFIGLGFYINLIPDFLRDRFFSFLFIPFFGFIFLAIVGSYFVGFDVNINKLVPALLLVASIYLAVNCIFWRARFFANFREIKLSIPVSLAYFTVIGTPLIMLLLLPVLLPGYLTSPYRIGPDLASYAKMAQYLLDGGTWSASNLRVSEFVGMSPGEINRYSEATMSWPLMFYFRWGLTAFQTAAANLTFAKHIYEVAFVSMLFPYLFTCGMILFWLKNKAGIAAVPAVLGAFAFVLNPNMLNMWYEGFYGNAFALSLFVFILIIFAYFREMPSIFNKSNIPAFILCSAAFAASLLSYGEGVFFVLPPFLVVVFVVDLLLNRSIRLTPYLAILGSAIFGLVMVLPCNFILQWAALTFKQLTQEGGNGYTQPLWAFPHEILGLASIYLGATPDVAGKELTRPMWQFILGIGLSLVAMYLLALYAKHKERKNNALHITAIFMTAVSAALVFYKSPQNNYTYMKSYVFFLPIVFIAFWTSLVIFYDKHLRRWAGHQVLFFSFFSIAIGVTGSVYILQYTNELTLVKKHQIALHKELEYIDFSNVVLYPVGISGSPVMYAAIIPAIWMMPGGWTAERWKDRPYYQKYLDHKVYIFAEKKLEKVRSTSIGTLVFENDAYLIIDTGKRVRDGIGIDTQFVFEVYTGIN
ncbi:hypothetical protein [Polaromonas sp. YR568]|uniref:hypothetical protein n=1 Tax=Polaromonas sp. YR568 TaxID=1855301 RepID=UPI003137828A